MRFLILNIDYSAFLRWLYTQHPALDGKTYQEQLRARNDSLFGVANFLSANLQKLGHEAWDIHANNESLQKQWTPCHDLRKDESTELYNEAVGVIQKTRRLAGKTPLRNLKPLFKPLLNWLDKRQEWFYSTMEKQIKYYQPDVLLNMEISSFNPDFLREMKRHFSLLVGLHAAPLPQGIDFSVYDLMLSSLPNLVDYFRELGIPSELLRLGFETSILEKINKMEESIPVSFVGHISSSHSSRTQWLEDVCRRVPVEVWCNGVEDLPENSPIRKAYRGSAWGLEMYRILINSRITLNHHINMAESYANNMRLFEATGVGTMLLTDWKQNLNDMFELGKEVAAYHSSEECAKMISYFLEHENEREEIARAGQKRTLQDHTYFQRAQEMVDVINEFL